MPSAYTLTGRSTENTQTLIRPEDRSHTPTHTHFFLGGGEDIEVKVEAGDAKGNAVGERTDGGRRVEPYLGFLCEPERR